MRRLLLLAVLAACGPGPEASHDAPGVLLPERPARPGVWITAEELAELPMEGPSWRALLERADQPLGAVDLSDRDEDDDVLLLAKALVAVRRGDDRLAREVRRGCAAAIGTEEGGDCLAFARNLPSLVVAADLVGLGPELEPRFRSWLRFSLGAEHDGRSLRSTHEERPNNWGTHAGAARVVIARYLGDERELGRAAAVFRGWLGERSSYAGFRFRETWWQADPENPVGVDPAGARRGEHSLDGVLPDDQRRSGPFSWPPPKENYVYEALQGALVQAVVLERAGYDPFAWGDRALLRAFRWLHEEANFPAEGDDTWQPHVVDRAYGVRFPAPVPSRPGKNMGFTDWTHPTVPAGERGGEPGAGKGADG